LADQRDQAPDGEDKADIGLGPCRGRQVDGDERAEAGLQVGDEEDKPVERVTAATRADCGGFSRRCRADKGGSGVERDAAQRTVIVLKG
jgi:hypothetical protein